MRKLRCATLQMDSIEEEETELELNFKRDIFIEKIIEHEPQRLQRKPSFHSDLDSVEEEENELEFNLKRDNFIGKIIDKDPERLDRRPSILSELDSVDEED